MRIKNIFFFLILLVNLENVMIEDTGKIHVHHNITCIVYRYYYYYITLKYNSIQY